MVDEHRADDFERRAPPKTFRHIHKDENPKSPHFGEECAGNFIFIKDNPIDDVRVCLVCQRTETYDPKHLIIVGKPGVTEEELKKFCKNLFLTVAKKKKAMADHSEDIVKVVRSKNSVAGKHPVYAAYCPFPNAGVDRNPEELIAIADGYERIVAAVFRKPIVIYQ